MAKIGNGSLVALALLCTACVKSDAGPQAKQGWSRAETLNWYHGSQGSRLMPKAWFEALEVANSADRFFTIRRMQAFGYIAPDADDKSGLPIGFAVDFTDDSKLKRTQLRWFTGQGPKEPWIGLNCAACHTAEIRGGEENLRIEGGPGMGDFQSLVEQLDLSIEATLANPDKFQRFAVAVLGPEKLAQDSARLRGELARLAAWEQLIKAANDPAVAGRETVRYGHARLDAVGHILNKVAVLATYDAPMGSKPQFSAPADAPVSYPFIWNTQQHDRVQWNGIAANHGLKLPSGEIFDYGALGRNTGEVIGVFADVVLTKKAGLGGYESSVNVKNLDAMEVLLARLEPPRWPAGLGVPAKQSVDAGRILFAANCQECHAELPRIADGNGGERPDLKTPIRAVMTPIFGPRGVGTDPWMACNAFTFRARTGTLEGTRSAFVSGDPFTPIADNRQMLVAVITGTLAGQKRAIAATFAKALFGLPREIEVGAGFAAEETAQKSPQQRLAICKANAANELIAYKGRPLTGVWATAPYLHNGSVRSLYELLLPPAKRATSFPVGTRVLDPVRVGYVDADGTAPTTFTVNTSQGVAIPGNSNAGHDYGNAALSPTDRQALVDYMKTL
nr:di-heme-cytochrome C peroxidase [Polymorphobacter sp.]